MERSGNLSRNIQGRMSIPAAVCQPRRLLGREKRMALPCWGLPHCSLWLRYCVTFAYMDPLPTMSGARFCHMSLYFVSLSIEGWILYVKITYFLLPTLMYSRILRVTLLFCWSESKCNLVLLQKNYEWLIALLLLLLKCTGLSYKYIRTIWRYMQENINHF